MSHEVFSEDWAQSWAEELRGSDAYRAAYHASRVRIEKARRQTLEEICHPAAAEPAV